MKIKNIAKEFPHVSIYKNYFGKEREALALGISDMLGLMGFVLVINVNGYEIKQTFRNSVILVNHADYRTIFYKVLEILNMFSRIMEEGYLYPDPHTGIWSFITAPPNPYARKKRYKIPSTYRIENLGYQVRGRK